MMAVGMIRGRIVCGLGHEVGKEGDSLGWEVKDHSGSTTCQDPIPFSPP